MSDDLITARIGEPLFSFKVLAEVFVITETSSPPPGSWIATSALTPPVVTDLTVPRSLLRALICMGLWDGVQPTVRHSRPPRPGYGLLNKLEIFVRTFAVMVVEQGIINLLHESQRAQVTGARKIAVTHPVQLGKPEPHKR